MGWTVHPSWQWRKEPPPTASSSQSDTSKTKHRQGFWEHKAWCLRLVRTWLCHNPVIVKQICPCARVSKRKWPMSVREKEHYLDALLTHVVELHSSWELNSIVTATRSCSEEYPVIYFSHMNEYCQKDGKEDIQRGIMVFHTWGSFPWWTLSSSSQPLFLEVEGLMMKTIKRPGEIFSIWCLKSVPWKDIWIRWFPKSLWIQAKLNKSLNSTAWNFVKLMFKACLISVMKRADHLLQKETSMVQSGYQIILEKETYG